MRKEKIMSEIPIIVSRCDLYEDAWNPFFRLIKANWPEAPSVVYLITESKEYHDTDFDIHCIHSPSPWWSDRVQFALSQINATYGWFFLEDFFIESRVNNEIAISAVSCITNDKTIGVIKFIPHITPSWYDENKVVNEYFSEIPPSFSQRSNLMLSLYNLSYFSDMLRKKETPWDYELFGTHRSRHLKEKVLVQNNHCPLAFPYNYQIKYGYGISKRKWLKNNKHLFEHYGIQVDFERLGWYEYETSTKIIGLKRTFFQKVTMPITNPLLFWRIISTIMKNLFYKICHITHYF